MALTYQQSKLVKNTVPALREHGERITSLFYNSMLRDHPELNNYFNTVNQKNGRQPRALTAVILQFASNIMHISELIPKLERMCNKHCSLGIQPEHYGIVGKYLIQAFAEVLGPDMTPDVRAAWTAAYWVLAKMMIGRETQLYKNFDRWVGWRKFKIDRKVAEADDMYSFYLVPVDGRPLPSFLPGQYVSLQIHVPDIGYDQSRQFSLSEAPRPDYYRICVKRDQGMVYRNSVATSYINPGILTNELIDHYHPGDTVDLSHPAGEFFLDTNNTSSVPVVLVSAGVGVAPMVSILNTIAATQPGRQISWVHGSRRTVPFDEHLRSLRRRFPDSLRTNIFKTDLAGSDLAGVHYDFDERVDLAKVKREDLFLEHGGTEYYICGPEQFMLEMAEYIRDQGVDLHRVKFELFSTGTFASTMK
ncbi:uncharacterized protein E0L32_010865 [Thyridium curvatum]|uniref:nitric oxide dioxygenase n=1 Tax=Thyridium curvatum TaxID=1093900 RepID=A0A507AQY8_9PEZI|nr:uncharacterized protein E0L32_010865 [Thyridium curvatum]TPX07271.1 hypothetical protein E0L32_010865 [Thyridium curvatum]